jgi:hypothetical protein
MTALRLASAFGLLLALKQQQDIPVPKGAGSRISQPGVVNFNFEHRGLDPPHWAIEVYEDGSGRYDDLSKQERASAETRRLIHVGAATRHRLDGGFEKVSTGDCETHSKNLANTGTKTIAYRWKTGDIWVSCTFNYSDDKNLADASDAFQAIAETMQFGDRLLHAHRFDRLSLDAEIDSLTAELKDGRSIEIQNIAPTLQAIVDDERVMERARRKTARLLQDAGVASLPLPASPR